MNCSFFQPDLKAFCDGELSPIRRLTVRRHLAHCAACREEIKLMEQITSDLRAAEPAEALPPALRARILENTTGSPGTGGRRTRPLLRPAQAWIVAGMALVLWLILSPVFTPVRENARRISGAPSASYQAAEPAPASMRPFSPNDHSIAPALPTDRQVHKEATISVRVADPEEKSNEIEARAKEAGGFIAGNTLNTGGDGLKSADLTVKVPVMQFETVLRQIAKMGNVQAKNVVGEDITEKASDAAQAEAVLEDEEQRAQARLTSLGKKAGWADQQAMRDLRIQRAQARARLILLKKLAALSTITVTLSQTPKPVAAVSGGFLAGLTGTTHSATLSLLGSASLVLSLLIWIVAYAPLWIPLALGVRYAVRYFGRQADAPRA